MRALYRLLLWLSVIALLLLLLVYPHPASGATIRTINVAPGTNVPNLQAANDLLCSQSCDGIGQAVKIVIAPGTYTGSTKWSYSDPDYPTQIIGKNVVMDGQFRRGWGLTIQPKNEKSNLQFFYLTWARYTRGGIVQSGGGNDLIYANRFLRIGSYYSKQSDVWGYGGVMWKNVSGSTVKSSVFADILNIKAGYSHEHGVYIVHSSNNTVTMSKFINVGGDPIRIRDRSNDNTVSGNMFDHSGSLGYLGDWQCIENAMHDSCPDGDEGLSWHNVFESNKLNSPHPWHFANFRPVACYDVARTICSQQRVRTR